MCSPVLIGSSGSVPVFTGRGEDPLDFFGKIKKTWEIENEKVRGLCLAPSAGLKFDETAMRWHNKQEKKGGGEKERRMGRGHEILLRPAGTRNRINKKNSSVFVLPLKSHPFPHLPFSLSSTLLLPLCGRVGGCRGGGVY